MALQYTTARTHQHLSGIVELQRRNLPEHLEETEIQSQGFVTVVHRVDDLKAMNDIEPHVIVLEGERVAGYLLAMTRASRNNIPVLVPMFEMIETLSFKGERLSASSYIVIGQACVDKAHRGKGVFDALYQLYAECYRDRYRYVITEIDARNTRSLRAHQRIGFETINRYTASNGVTWHIVLWDWNGSDRI